ncbi:hypothetical protein R3P38DRAFT_3304824 [Favolaschia claudopus]|uniref:DUF6533 domain-containing protein n=1 Tax=Favolaschia claudopus TaxID=2862362 RepID=A0AAW0DVE5_9AGAR
MIETLSDAQIQHAIFISRILIIVPFTVLVYEYLLTLRREISAFWGTPLTWASFFFYVNRYSPLFGNLPILVQYFSTTTDPNKLHLCRGLRAYHQYYALLSQVLVAVMLIMRTYALYSQNKRILAVTICITLAAFVFAVWILLTGNDSDTFSSQIAALGCPLGTSHSKFVRFDACLAGAWSGMLIFDVMIFSLTLFKALQLNARQGGLLTVLLRDGVLMVISNASNIGTYTAFTRGSATTVTNVVSSVMISRLMFNIRNPNLRLPLSSGRTTRSETAFPDITTVQPYTSTHYATNTAWSTAGSD